MNILFLSVYDIADSNSGYIYADLVREFARRGDKVYAVTPTRKQNTCAFTDSNGVCVIKVKNGSIQKTGKIKKVLNLLLLENRTIKAVNKYAKGVKFDLVINMSSNLSYAKSFRYFKKKHGAKAYLLLKDISPQNAVDMEMMSPRGIMGFVYRAFKRKEKRLYSVSDCIGCLSDANVEYLLRENSYLTRDKVVTLPNSIEPMDVSLSKEDRDKMRQKYGIPTDKTVFVYGGNLGKPQGIPFIIDCLRRQKNDENAYFLIVGDGTEYGRLKEFMDAERPINAVLMQRLPREDYDRMVAACDVGLIFLDHRFTVPNYPSRLLSYMQAGLPVLACTDTSSDVGKTLTEGGFGWWCESNDASAFSECVSAAVSADRNEMKILEQNYLDKEFSVRVSYDKIMEWATK